MSPVEPTLVSPSERSPGQPLDDSVTVPLHRLAHARAGDKGDRLNLALFAYDPDHYALLLEQVTEERVLALFAHRGASRVRRYPMPGLAGMNLVIDDVLQGGVNGALNLDGHGKTLSFLLLGMTIAVKVVGETSEERAT